MPLSLISGILIVCATYAAINVSYFVVLSPEEMKNSTAVAAVGINEELCTYSKVAEKADLVKIGFEVVPESELLPHSLGL